MKLGRCLVRGPWRLCFVRVSPSVQVNYPIAYRTEARLSQPICPVVPARAGLAISRPPPAPSGRREERQCPRRSRCVGAPVARVCSCRVRSRARDGELAGSGLGLTRPLPVLQSRARQSESILSRPCNPTRLDPAAYPAAFELQVQVLSPTVA